MNTIHRLLVIRLSALGDICMTLPVIDSACRAYPNVEFTLLTTKVGSIVANSVIHRPNFKTRSINKRDYNGISGLNRLYSELKSLGFDAVADLHDVLRTKWVDLRFRLAGKPVVKIDKGRSEKKALVAHAIDRQLRTSVERYHDVFRALGMNFELDYHPQEVPSETVQAGAMSNAEATKSLGIGIAPFAQHQGKVYPAPMMREAIDRVLQQRPDAHIYLFGSREEQSILDVWASAHPEQITNLAGRQSIDADLKVMRQLRLMVSMDSANMHLASLVGLRCLSIWGATHRHAGFLGFGQSDDDCIELPMECRPCSIYGNKPCTQGNYPCLTGITPESVAQRILQAIED